MTDETTAIGIFEGHRSPDNRFTFYPLNPAGIGGEASIVVTTYHPPVTPPTLDWYIARGHALPPDGRHSGLDVNLNKSPWGDVDLGQPVYATCAGLVVFAGLARGTFWGNLVVTVSLDGEGLIFWRYAHLQDVMTQVGRVVEPGEQVGTIGKGYNDRYYAHLHVDCWRGHMLAPGSWLAPGVEWLDPIEVWTDAGCEWQWGRR